jgi:hypothetical protein
MSYQSKQLPVAHVSRLKVLISEEEAAVVLQITLVVSVMRFILSSKRKTHDPKLYLPLCDLFVFNIHAVLHNLHFL